MVGRASMASPGPRTANHQALGVRRSLVYARARPRAVIPRAWWEKFMRPLQQAPEQEHKPEQEPSTTSEPAGPAPPASPATPEEPSVSVPPAAKSQDSEDSSAVYAFNEQGNARVKEESGRELLQLAEQSKEALEGWGLARQSWDKEFEQPSALRRIGGGATVAMAVGASWFLLTVAAKYRAQRPDHHLLQTRVFPAHMDRGPRAPSTGARPAPGAPRTATPSTPGGPSAGDERARQPANAGRDGAGNGAERGGDQRVGEWDDGRAGASGQDPGQDGAQSNGGADRDAAWASTAATMAGRAPWELEQEAGQVRTRYDREEKPGTWDRWSEASQIEVEEDHRLVRSGHLNSWAMQQRVAAALKASERASEAAESAAAEAMTATSSAAVASKAAADAAAYASRASRAMQVMSEDSLLEAERLARRAFQEAYKAEQMAHRARMAAREHEARAAEAARTSRRMAEQNDEQHPLLRAARGARMAVRHVEVALGTLWSGVRQGLVRAGTWAGHAGSAVVSSVRQARGDARSEN